MEVNILIFLQKELIENESIDLINTKYINRLSKNIILIQFFLHLFHCLNKLFDTVYIILKMIKIIYCMKYFIIKIINTFKYKKSSLNFT